MHGRLTAVTMRIACGRQMIFSGSRRSDELPEGACCGLRLRPDLFLGALYAFQRPFQQYHGVEYRRLRAAAGLAADHGEWAFARLMFPPGPNDGYRGRFDGDWRLGTVALDAGLSARRSSFFAKPSGA